MPRITFLALDGRRIDVDAESGLSAMEAAVRSGVPGIVAECGGACSCATCHVYLDEGWADRVGEASTMERDLLDFASEPQANSRLSCQIKVSEELDGLRLTVPEAQD